MFFCLEMYLGMSACLYRVIDTLFLFFWSVWTWSKQCPQLSFPAPTCLCTFSITCSSPKGAPFSPGFPCSSTPGRWMFSSFCILARTGVVPGMPPHLCLSAGGGVVTHTLSPLTKGDAVGESWARWNCKGGWRCPFASWTPCIISPRHKRSSWQPDQPPQFNPAAELALALILLPLTPFLSNQMSPNINQAGSNTSWSTGPKT